MFQINENKGFHITFTNGITISCQIGNTNYCDNRIIGVPEMHKEMNQYITTCNNCEIAIWDKYDNWRTYEIFEKLNLLDECILCDDMVAGYINSDTVAKIITYVSTL